MSLEKIRKNAKNKIRANLELCEGIIFRQSKSRVDDSFDSKHSISDMESVMNWLENNQDIANVYIMDNVLRVGGKYHWQDAFECFFDKEEFESTWNHYQSFESPQSKAGTESKKEAEREANYEQGNVIYHDFGNGPH